jgi:transcriptional regulator with XRE-family HTH domain
MINIGLTLRSLREERGYTLRQLAEKAQVPHSHISNIENGKKTPGLDVIDRICFALGVPTRDVIIKSDLDREFKTDQKKMYKDLMPYFRKIEAVAKQIYGSDGSDSDERDDNREREGLKPIIRGGGAKKVNNLNEV